MQKKEKGIGQPDRILSYFKAQWPVLLIVTLTGLIYNIGLLAGPWFEGKMAGCLVDVLGKRAVYSDMLALVISYVVTIAVVQIARYCKRFYVRRFANNVNRQMKEILYSSLVQKSRTELEEEGAGNVMTKAILDVDDCVEGMRKFTTEVFDTGVALIAYAGMLLFYDWRLALLCMLFPPISYKVAEKMKGIVQRTGAIYKEKCGALSAATLDRALNAITYRVYGCEEERKAAYEKELSSYEKAAVKANIWSSTLPPVYRVISMAGVLCILYFGSRNVLGIGWKVFDVAVFTTFLSCFTRLSVKATPFPETKEEAAGELVLSHVSFAYPGGGTIYRDVSLQAEPGEIIGVTGPVACGKSTFGKTFLCEYPYEGSITFGGRELQELTDAERSGSIGYLGHDPELFDDTIRNNILLGKDEDPGPLLKAVCLYQEVEEMEHGMDTVVGNGGIRLSGGQAKRLALARTLCHKRPVLVLDDPFSALDKETEKQVFASLKKLAADSIVILLSHRLYLFPQMDQVIFMEKGRVITGSHESVLKNCPEYRKLNGEQEGGADR